MPAPRLLRPPRRRPKSTRAGRPELTTGTMRQRKEPIAQRRQLRLVEWRVSQSSANSTVGRGAQASSARSMKSVAFRAGARIDPAACPRPWRPNKIGQAVRIQSRLQPPQLSSHKRSGLYSRRSASRLPDRFNATDFSGNITTHGHPPVQAQPASGQDDFRPTPAAGARGRPSHAAEKSLGRAQRRGSFVMQEMEHVI